jgi:hypothetical protein
VIDQDKALAAAMAALQQIARGNRLGTRPLPGTDAQEIARRVLIESGSDWTKRGTETDSVS